MGLMHCSCCDVELTDSEATAKFVEPDGAKPYRFVDMCTKCRQFLPPEIKIVSRSLRTEYDPEIRDDPFDLQDYDDDESW